MRNEQPSMVIGASGLVGSWLMKCLGGKAIGTYYSQPRADYKRLDIRDKRAVEELIQSERPRVVYCPAARPGVDFCEQHPHDSYETNVRGIDNVVRAAKQVGALLVFFSSDYIFDGRNGPYSESNKANPICVYGQHKLQAERLIGELLPDRHIIARITVVYGWEKAGKNFVFRLVDSLRNNKQVHVPIDQIGSPTYVPSMAKAAIELAQKELVGTWHICGPRCMDRYEFAVMAARIFGLDESLIEAVNTDELQQAASRPLRAGMKVDRAKEVLRTTLVAPEVGLEDMYNTENSFRDKNGN